MSIPKTIQQGQTLIEALSAMAVIALILSAITVAVITSINNATYDQDQTLSAKYAEEGTEIVRQIRDTNYKTFPNLKGKHCLDKGQSKLKAYCTTPNIDGIFVRQVIIQTTGCPAGTLNVVVNVSFKDGKCTSNTYCHVTSDTTCMSTVNPVQAP